MSEAIERDDEPSVDSPGRGRPTKYRAEYAAEARELCERGATNAELAAHFGVGVATISYWQARFPDFSDAVIAGKEKADDRVERALFERAVGYTHDAVKIFMPAEAAAPVYAPYQNHIAPDVVAAKMWLINRRPDRWRDRHDVNHGVQSDNPLASFLDSLAGRGKTLQPVEEPARVEQDDDAPKFE